MIGLLKKYFSDKSLKKLQIEVGNINVLEEEVKLLSDDGLKLKSLEIKEKIKNGEDAKDFLYFAYALAREAAKRTLGERPFDTQIMAGLVLNSGSVAEMVTGEGKTLAAVAPTYFNALSGKGAHVVTVNEYLARRDAVWMGQIYRALGLSVSCLVPNAAYMYDPDWRIPENAEKMIDAERDTTGSFLVQQEFLKPISRREAYLTDITYGTNHEFGFDYLRDNLVYRLEDTVQRELHYAIIDEVDSILIDESRTPLIIAAPDAQSSEFYKTFARVVRGLEIEADYKVDEKRRAVTITESGIEKVEKMIGLQNIYASENLRLVHYLEESLKAKTLFQRDKDYVVKDGEIIIVDEFTGRLLQGRRYQGGLHQAIEAKEGVYVKEESRTYAKISIQNYFRMYKKIAGMTGTAQTSAEEFFKVYGLEVVSIPTNKPLIRKDGDDLIYKTKEARWRAVVEEVKDRNKRGQPVLLGTTSIEKNELLSSYLSQAGVKYELLNAKNNEREGAIIAQAGRAGAVTVATNMAGRGVDIILGGNPPDAEEGRKVREAGGLHVIGTERHEARRIDNQLRGRAGRQGDPGSSQFFLSLEDDLLRIFGGDRVKKMMERFNLPEDMPIKLGLISKVVSEAQAKVEGYNFDLRKHLLEYDDVLNKQRTSIYKKRLEILSSFSKENLAQAVFEASSGYLDKLLPQLQTAKENSPEAEIPAVKKIFEEAGIVGKGLEVKEDADIAELEGLLRKRSLEAAEDSQTLQRLLGILDMFWMNHLEELEALSGSVGLRAYGQKDPLVEYRQESRVLFSELWDGFNGWVFMNIFKLANSEAQNMNSSVVANRVGSSPAVSGKIGRNDPCPCGSGKKYKKCHGS